MAKIKFDPAATPLNKEHYGFTFQRNAYGHSMFPAGKNDRKRYPLQWEKMQFMSKAIRNWRNMSAETKNAWNVFATTFPQPTENDPNQYLSGYQLFIKRNYYRFLHEGIEFDFLYEPELSELPEPNFEIHIQEDGMCIDVTEEYIHNHGILPKIGQYIICRIIPIAIDSGQFFQPLIATLEVQEVYIDGLIASFHFSAIPEKIVFSLYMSKPVYESNQYAGTKFRYMGCFKPTKFIQLTDTPASYDGQAGKFVAVKDDETGLEFIDAAGCEVCPPVPGPGDAGKVITVNPAGDGYELAEGGGGGLNCEDLLECPQIIQILNRIDFISEFLIEENNSSIPASNFGLLYNHYAVDAQSSFLRDNFFIPDNDIYLSIWNSIGGLSVAGEKTKEISELYWDPPINGDNEKKLNIRGAGNRSGANGLFSNLRKTCIIWCADMRTQDFPYNWRWSAGALGVDPFYFLPKSQGLTLRPLRIATGMADGSTGIYVGNDGKTYRTIVINQYEILADNLAETKFNDGTEIPEVTDPVAWSALTTPALCAYDNYWPNV